jgi:hypothetical protein
MFGRDRSYPAFYFGKEAANSDADLLRAFRWLAERSAEGVPLMIIPTKAQLNYSETLAAISKRIRTETARTFKSFKQARWPGGPVLAVWPTAEIVATLDDDDRVSSLLVLTWLPAEIDGWRRARNAVDILTGTTSTAPITIDAVVAIAIQHLTDAVNLSSGLSHPMDKARAVDTFRLLRKAKYSWDSDEIRIWALGHGWDNRGANELAGVAQRIGEGRAVQARPSGLRADIVQMWRDEAASS